LGPNKWEVNYDPIKAKVTLTNDGIAKKEIDPF